MRRLTFSILSVFLLAACATAPAEKEEKTDEDDPKNLTCTEDRELGSPRDPAKVCRGY